MVWRMGFNPDVTFMQMALPTLLTGPFMVMFFVPVTGLAMASVKPDEQANAAGLSNFMRTLAGAFATSIVQTGWSNATRQKETALVDEITQGSQAVQGFMAEGFTHIQATAALGEIIDSQSVMLATLKIFTVIALIFFLAAALIWFVPKPKGKIDVNHSH